jgi:arsenate reductase (glutaredoxin)
LLRLLYPVFGFPDSGKNCVLLLYGEKRWIVLRYPEELFRSLLSASYERGFAIFGRMITIYGIKNCDTMQKALKWLNAKKVAYTFHNYKESGIDKATLEQWLRHFATDKLINTKGTTYRGLTDAEKASIGNKSKAVALMMKNTSVIKRPVWDFGNGIFFLGWDEQEVSKLLPKN